MSSYCWVSSKTDDFCQRNPSFKYTRGGVYRLLKTTNTTRISKVFAKGSLNVKWFSFVYRGGLFLLLLRRSAAQAGFEKQHNFWNKSVLTWRSFSRDTRPLPPSEPLNAVYKLSTCPCLSCKIVYLVYLSVFYVIHFSFIISKDIKYRILIAPSLLLCMSLSF